MLKSFFKIALRYLWRKKTYSVLNFVCLTFGLTCAIITVLYIRNVFSYDKFHKNYDRLYSVDAYVTYFNGDRFPKEYLSASLSDVLKVQAPEIEEMTRIAERDYSFISGDKTFTEKGFYVDNNFFNIFTFPLVKAGSLNVLTDPNSIAIYCTPAGLHGTVWTRFFHFRKPYQKNWDQKGQWGNNFIRHATVADQLYQMADHRLFYSFAHCFDCGKNLSWKVLFPCSDSNLGIFGRAGHCFRCSIINS